MNTNDVTALTRIFAKRINDPKKFKFFQKTIDNTKSV